MPNRVVVQRSFDRPAKRLAKRYASFTVDLRSLIIELESNAKLGVSLGGNVRKIRMAIRSKGKGKSGGARVIAYLYLEKERVHLLTVYDKSERESISDEDIEELVAKIGDLN